MADGEGGGCVSSKEEEQVTPGKKKKRPWPPWSLRHALVPLAETGSRREGVREKCVST